MTDWTMTHVTDSYAFPADLADDADLGAGALRWTAMVVVLTTALLALVNAQSIRSWAEELPPGPTTVQLVSAAGAWEEATAQTGLGTGRARLHKAWRGFEEARWTPQAQASEEARR